MRILYLGEISPGQTYRMRMRALERLGRVNSGAQAISGDRLQDEALFENLRVVLGNLCC
jgi:hypothetical protein